MGSSSCASAEVSMPAASSSRTGEEEEGSVFQEETGKSFLLQKSAGTARPSFTAKEIERVEKN